MAELEPTDQAVGTGIGVSGDQVVGALRIVSRRGHITLEDRQLRFGYPASGFKDPVGVAAEGLDLSIVL